MSGIDLRTLEQALVIATDVEQPKPRRDTAEAYIKKCSTNPMVCEALITIINNKPTVQ